MTTIRELLEQEPKHISSSIQYIVSWYYTHIPEITAEDVSDVMYDPDFAPDIKTVFFYDVSWDHRRGQSIFAVKYLDQWVMLCYNAGRSGGDHSRKQILNEEMYVQMVAYIKVELLKRQDVDVSDVVSLDEEVRFEFYGHDVRRGRPLGF